MPFVLGLYFKTRQHTATLFTAEFSQRRTISLKIWNKKPRVSYGGDLFTMTYPNLADAQWHTVAITVTDNRLNFTIDFVYTATFALTETFYGGLVKVFIGSASGTVSSQAFLGCVKVLLMTHYCISEGYCMHKTFI